MAEDKKPSQPEQKGKTGGPEKATLLDNLLVVGLALYALALTVLAVDQVFLGSMLFPPKLTKMLRADIAVIADAGASAADSAKARDEIINYHEFSVPHLIKALESDNKAAHQPAAECLAEIRAKFFMSKDENEAVAKMRQELGPQAAPKVDNYRKQVRDSVLKNFGVDAKKWGAWWKATEAELDARADIAAKAG